MFKSFSTGQTSKGPLEQSFLYFRFNVFFFHIHRLQVASVESYAYMGWNRAWTDYTAEWPWTRQPPRLLPRQHTKGCVPSSFPARLIHRHFARLVDSQVRLKHWRLNAGELQGGSNSTQQWHIDSMSFKDVNGCHPALPALWPDLSDHCVRLTGGALNLGLSWRQPPKLSGALMNTCLY